jgi:S1-C subfamily serine protease
MVRQLVGGFGWRWLVGAAAAMVLLAPSVGWAKMVQAKRSAGGYLGVMLAPTERNEPGVVIRDVTNDGPAAKAGVKNGDRVTKIDNQNVQNIDSFMRMVESKKSGDKVTLHVIRSGQDQEIAITLGERPNMQENLIRQWPGELSGRRPALLGVQTAPLTQEMKTRLNVKADSGVVIVEVTPNSAAAKAGIKQDDVITSMNGTNIQGPPQLRELLQQNGIDKEATVQIVRGNEQLTLKITPTDAAMGIPWRSDRLPMDMEPMSDTVRKIRELERRIEDLEKRVRELEGKRSPPSQ